MFLYVILAGALLLAASRNGVHAAIGERQVIADMGTQLAWGVDEEYVAPQKQHGHGCNFYLPSIFFHEDYYVFDPWLTIDCGRGLNGDRRRCRYQQTYHEF